MNDFGQNRARNLFFEIIGLTCSMFAGAFIGTLPNGNGMGFFSFILLCSVLGCVLWYRRGKRILSNIGLCVLAIILWWPVGLAIRDAFRDWP